MLLSLSLTLSLILCSCRENNELIEKQPVLYYKTIEVVVISNEKTSWYSGIWRHKQTIRVRSIEYNIEQEFNFYNNGVFTNMPYWNCKQGDIIIAELYSWKNKSTGQIEQREINELLNKKGEF